jgi:hypothetical protein
MLPVAVPAVIQQNLDDGTVLFDPETELYFGLNEVGALVWSLLPPACESLDQLCEQVAVRYPDVPLATIRSDVTELLEQLVAEGLASRSAPGGIDAAPAP